MTDLEGRSAPDAYGANESAEVRILTTLSDRERFELLLAEFLDACPYVVDGYCFSIHELTDEA